MQQSWRKEVLATLNNSATPLTIFQISCRTGRDEIKVKQAIGRLMEKELVVKSNSIFFISWSMAFKITEKGRRYLFDIKESSEEILQLGISDTMSLLRSLYEEDIKKFNDYCGVDKEGNKIFKKNSIIF